VVVAIVVVVVVVVVAKARGQTGNSDEGERQSLEAVTRILVNTVTEGTSACATVMCKVFSRIVYQKSTESDS
jgi:hypothetical protein